MVVNEPSLSVVKVESTLKDWWYGNIVGHHQFLIEIIAAWRLHCSDPFFLDNPACRMHRSTDPRGRTLSPSP